MSAAEEVKAVARAMYVEQARRFIHPEDPEDVPTPEEAWEAHPYKQAWFSQAEPLVAALAPIREAEQQTARRLAAEHFRERTDEIEGARITLPDGSILWLHTADQIDTWLRDLAATRNEGGE